LDAVDGHAQFFGCGFAQFGSRALTAFDFADHDGDGAVLPQVDARGDVARATAATASAALSQCGSGANGHEQPGTQQLHEGSPLKAKVISDRLD
jgi:hypothetical protein